MSAVFPKIGSFKVIFFQEALEESTLSIVLDRDQSTLLDERAVKDIFEIHAPGIDTGALVRELEERMRSRGHTAEELERIRNLSFTPVSPAGRAGFDPALTSELFEQPVASPDFKSRKFRFLKGPLRWLALRIFKLLAQIHDKLSENKTQAFYNVVHELIAVNHRHGKLRENFDAVLLENLRLRAELRDIIGRHAGESDFAEEKLVPGLEYAAVIPELAPDQEKALHGFLDLLPAEPSLKEGPACCLDDDWARTAFELRGRGHGNVVVNVPDALRFAVVGEIRDVRLFRGEADLCLAEQGDASLALIVLPNLNCLSGTPDVLPELIARKLAPGGRLLLRSITDSHERAFTPTVRFRVNRRALLDEFTAAGLVAEGDAESSGDQDDFTALLRKPAFAGGDAPGEVQVQSSNGVKTEITVKPETAS